MLIRKMRIFLFVTAAIVGAAPSSYAQDATDMFSAYAGTLQSNPLSRAEFEELMRESGLAKISSLLWRHVDDAGNIVTILAGSNQKYYSVKLIPQRTAHFGDAALAALIDKAVLLSIDDGNSLEVLLPKRRYSRGNGTVEVQENLSFKLAGGLWWKTSVSIEWSR